MKKITLILILLALISCNNKKIQVKIDALYFPGNPNMYISDAKLYKNDKNFEYINIDNDGEKKSTTTFDLAKGQYTIKWTAFSKNMLGAKLRKEEKSDKINIESESDNLFAIIGDKILNTKEYKSYKTTDSIIKLEVEEIENAPIYLRENKDEMTDKITYSASRHLKLEDGNNNVEIFIFIKKINNKFIQDGLCAVIDIGSLCVEDNKLIVLFDDGSKVSLNSWNDFNCDGNAFFYLSSDQCVSFSTKKVNKIRVENGRSHDEMTVTLEKNKDYFIQVFSAMKNNKVKSS